MIRIRCFGPARLDAPAAASPESVLAQPKRLALFAFLVLSDDGMEARDSLLSMFWPDSPEASARGSLRQALRYLRRALGDDVLATRGRGWVGVNRQRVQCDVWEFERRLEAGDRAEALALYEGELLQGLELRGSPGFEPWLAGRRRRLAQRAAAAAWELAEEAREAGDAAAALSRARRAREIQPADEEGVRRLMGLQLWAGDRSGALQTYERFGKWLAAEFEAVPSVKTRELAERARGPMVAVVAEPVRTEPPEPSARAGAAGEKAPARAYAVPGPRRARGGVRRIGVVAAVVLVLAVVGWWVDDGMVGSASAAGGADPDRVVVRPFRVQGPGSSLDFMARGVAEIFGSVFTGDAGPVAVEAGAPEASGATWEATGLIMGDARQLYLQASLGPTGAPPHYRTSVSGAADSLYALARELAMRLLALQAGVPPEEAALLGHTEPAALRAYLSGREAYRRGAYEVADTRYKEALRHDSTFAQAAVGLVETHLGAPWLRGHAFATALPLAFRLRDRLGAADRQLVTAVAGPRYPLRSTQAEYYQAWERAVVQAPDRAAVWYQWGDALYHVGPFLGLPDHRARAAAAFARGLELDSTYLLPLVHLVEMAVDAGRIDEARAYLDRYLADPRDPPTADYLRWRVALGAGDHDALEEVRAHFPEMDVASLGGIMKTAQFTATAGLEDARTIAALDPSRWSAPAERWTMLFRFHSLALNEGRTDAARRLADAMADVAPSPHEPLHLLVRDALFDHGDPDAAEAAARRLAPPPGWRTPHDSGQHPELIADVCVQQAWRAHQGDTDGLGDALRWLRDPAMHPSTDTEAPRGWCADYLDALRAHRDGGGPMTEHIERLQSLIRQGIDIPGVNDGPFFLLAELLEEAGDVAGAREVLALRRSVPYLLAPRIREQARLAALDGDTAAAGAAYRHYLALRSRPDARVQPEVDQVRREYRALTGR